MHFSLFRHSAGDPDDKSMRRIESDVLVSQIVRDRTRLEKCVPEVAAFDKCCKANSAIMVVKCRPETKALRDCSAIWYNDKDFRAECTQIYLEQRSEYRRTGISEKNKAKLAARAEMTFDAATPNTQ